MYLQAICNCWIKLITHHFKLSEVEKPMMPLNMRVKTTHSKSLSENDISEWSGNYLFIVLDGPEIWSYFQPQKPMIPCNKFVL